MKMVHDKFEECNRAYFKYGYHLCRCISIGNAIRDVCPTTFHALCTYHLKRNLEVNFKDKVVITLFESAAAAFHKSEVK